MKKLTIYNSLSLVEKTELQGIAEEIHFLSKKTAEITFRIGQGLSRARDIFRHKDGGFQEWLETEFNESRQRAYQYIQFYEQKKSDSSSVNGRLHLEKLDGISERKLFLMYAPSTPESAREEILESKEAGENITETLIKEKIEAHKEIERLKAENEALKNSSQEQASYELIPQIQALLDNKKIMPAMGRAIQKMPPDSQGTWFGTYVQKMSYENQLEEEKAKSKQALEKALKAIEEKEEALKQLQSVSGTDNAQLIARHQQELKAMREEYRRCHIQNCKDIEQRALESNKEEIKKAYDARDKAEKKANKADNDFKVIATEHHKLQAKVRTLEEQLKVDSPSNIDAAHAERLKDILESLENRLIRFEEDRLTLDYPMNKTWAVINKAISVLSGFRDRTEGIVCINKIGE